MKAVGKFVETGEWRKFLAYRKISVYNMGKCEKGGSSMGREFELKFRADPTRQALILERFGAFAAIAMETTYYDAPDGALSDRKITLRRRLEGGKSVCTLKTPAKDGSRGEWELECDRIEAAIPELCKLSGWEELTFLTAGGVEPVCGARFDRLAKTVVLPDCTVEIALDRGILTGGGREIPLCEVEVELKAGSEAAAVAFARELATEYGLQTEKKSKFRRALALARA